jgi:hypothetical protein
MSTLRDARLRLREAIINRWMIAATFQRQLGPVDGCHNEWSVICDMADGDQSASPDLITIAWNAIGRAIRSDPSALVAAGLSQKAVVWPGEHYRILPALAEAVGARQIVEIGTWRGESAVAFLDAPGVERVDTFDIVPWSLVDGTALHDDDFGDRLVQHLGDLAVPRVFAEYEETLTNADLLFVDGPKDGGFETAFLDRLLAVPRRHPQLVVLDDIRVMTMIRVWRALPAPKLDITSFGHWSGTGLLLLAPRE